MTATASAFAAFAESFEGEFHSDATHRTLYATDASAFQETPAAVAIPRSEADIQRLIAFARAQGLALVPRTAGTSLAGQVVGSGIVVDVSRHFTRILQINPAERWVRVQPGVIRNELNLALAPHGLLFGPETSTANRAMIGGMVGNNSCGSNSLVYGSTRDHLLAVRGFLSDGSEVEFRDLDRAAFQAKCDGPPDRLETQMYRQIRDRLSDPDTRAEITRQFPKPSIPRRNTGYAVDLLMDCEPLGGPAGRPFNFCKLVAGSEGTLMFLTEITLRCQPLPPPAAALLCAHFETVDQALRANLLALRHRPSACELIDRFILDCTKANIEQSKNRFFLQGDPGAVLVVEIRRDSDGAVRAVLDQLVAELRAARLGYHFPILTGPDQARIWELRRAGQGLLSNLYGDAKPVEVIEDTAVDVAELPEYIRQLDAMLQGAHGVQAVYYAHAGTGELHVRPIVNLKTPDGHRAFRAIARDTARLVKQFGGSLSGEHGDGRLRGEFLPLMIGPANYRLIESIKRTWDPTGLFNPGKIVGTPPMDASLRHHPGQPNPEHPTTFAFAATGGMLRAAEQCSGSGDCRKTQLTGGTMCPSYMATRNEKDSTRARANILRHALTQGGARHAFNRPDVLDVLDLCLSCKGCKNECPSNVDLAKLKAEYLQQSYDRAAPPLRARLIAQFAASTRLATFAPALWNALFAAPGLGPLAKLAAGFHPDRSIPPLPATTLRRWFRTHRRRARPAPSHAPRLWLFADEFTDTLDASIGIATVQLFERLGYHLDIPPHTDSGRPQLSKGFVRDARRLAERNVQCLAPLVSDDAPLVGLEPSALLTFRDEVPDLVRPSLRAQARHLAAHALLFEEFVAREIDRGRIQRAQFQPRALTIQLHGHCHQKALSSLVPAVRALELPEGHDVRIIPSGCCGMAGSFGFEREHYRLSMDIGELVLFPAIRAAPSETVIAAPGTSCRHQILDGTGRHALHPAEILLGALHPA